jgi:hypothetical protein
MSALFPIKWASELNKSSLNTEVKLIIKCIDRKETRNRPESAMAIFLAIEDFKIGELDICLY